MKRGAPKTSSCLRAGISFSSSGTSVGYAITKIILTMFSHCLDKAK